MRINGIAAFFATLPLAVIPAMAGQQGMHDAQEAANAAQQAFAQADPDGPGYEGGFQGSWFPTVKPETGTEALDATGDEGPIDPGDIPDVPRDAQYRVERGDTFKAVLLRAGASPHDAERAIRALAKVYDPRRLKPGIEIFLQLQPQKKNKSPALLSIDFIADPETDVAVLRESDGNFSAKTFERTLTPRLAHGRAVINSSLYNAGQEAGIPSSILNSLVTDEGGTVVSGGDIVVATMTLSGLTTTLYRFKTQTGYTDFFDEDGQSAQKSLLRTPTDAARISSGFGRRRHPILGYNRMHRGIDFAAPPGTPVYAAGDGLIEKAGWSGGYGKYIRIRHGGSFKTAYAHLRRFASGIKTGVRVKQRQVIGYIGATGRATGPHLHYEVINNGKQVNPRKLRLAAGYRLKGEELKKFKTNVAETQERLEAFREKLAQKQN
jgi:murein DD-endopeptidase MepM/ murein hydrolase activator NlpD